MPFFDHAAITAYSRRTVRASSIPPPIELAGVTTGSTRLPIVDPGVGT